MSNKQKYQDIFVKSLSIETKKFSEKIKYNEIPEWDSIGHMALMAELEANISLAEATVKKICSQDMIQGHRMRRDPISFRPTHLSMLASNHKPDCRGTDNGIWRRLVLVPFTVNLEEKKDVTIPQQLVSEYGGILGWLLKGYKDFAENGLGTCKAVEQATLEYRDDED